MNHIIFAFIATVIMLFTIGIICVIALFFYQREYIKWERDTFHGGKND